MDNWEDAGRHFEDALTFDEKIGARPWLARSQYEYAWMLQERNRPGDREKAQELVNQALATFEELGMKKDVVVMEVTAYCACKKCCEWKRKWGCFLLPPVFATGPNKGKRKAVGVTADGSKAKKGTIAADTRRYPFGTIMYVPGYGWGVVHDRGRAIKGNHIDVFFSSHNKALKWGRQRLKVKVYRR